MYLKSDMLFYIFHVVCDLHYDNVVVTTTTTIVPQTVLRRSPLTCRTATPQFDESPLTRRMATPYLDAATIRWMTTNSSNGHTAVWLFTDWPLTWRPIMQWFDKEPLVKQSHRAQHCIFEINTHESEKIQCIFVNSWHKSKYEWDYQMFEVNNLSIEIFSWFTMSLKQQINLGS